MAELKKYWWFVSQLKNGAVLFYDCETTGLDRLHGGIVQFTGILCEYKDGKFVVIEVFNTYINPEVPVDPSAAKVTGITDEFLQDKPFEDEVFPKIKEMFDRANFICGHNIIGFDNKWIADLYARNGFPGTFSKDDISIDTLRIAREMVPREKAHNKSHKLCDMLDYYGLSVEGEFHDSLTDVKSCIVLLERQMQDMPKEAEKESGNVNIKVNVKSVIPWMASFPGAYQKANFLFINTDCGKWRFNRYNYRWEEVEKWKNVTIDAVKKATYDYCGVSYGDDGDLAHWKAS